MLTIKDHQGRTVGILKDSDTEPDMLDTIKRALDKAKSEDESTDQEEEEEEEGEQK